MLTLIPLKLCQRRKCLLYREVKGVCLYCVELAVGLVLSKSKSVATSSPKTLQTAQQKTRQLRKRCSLAEATNRYEYGMPLHSYSQSAQSIMDELICGGVFVSRVRWCVCRGFAFFANYFRLLRTANGVSRLSSRASFILDRLGQPSQVS